MLLLACRSGPRYLEPLVLLAVSTGCRLNELLSARWSNIDFARRTFWIENGKGGVDRDVPLSEQAMAALHSLPRTGANLFPVRSIKTAFRTARRRAGLDPAITFHSLRHAFGSMLAEAGVDAHAIRTLMGHSTLAMSIRYVHLSESRLKAAVESLPRFGQQDREPERSPLTPCRVAQMGAK